MRRRLVVLAWLVIPSILEGQSTQAPEPRDRATMSRDEEIAFALSGAPAVVARGAGVYVMGDSGFVRTRESTNGYNCIVERGSRGLDRVPICHDRSGSTTLLRETLLRGRMARLGRSPAEISDSVARSYRRGEFKAPLPGGVSYMLAPDGYFTNPNTNRRVLSPPHMMTYAPYMTYEDLGAPPGTTGEFQRSGVGLLNPGAPDAYLLIFRVPVSSDTTTAKPASR